MSKPRETPPNRKNSQRLTVRTEGLREGPLAGSPASASTTAATPKTPTQVPRCPLVETSASIFLPFNEDIFNPDDTKSQERRGRIQRLKYILETIDVHRAGVKENMVVMYEREKRRIIAEATQRESSWGQPVPSRSLSPAEVDAWVANMTAPADPGLNYSNIPASTMAVDFEPPANTAPRDRLIMELIRLVERAVMELSGFEGLMAGIRDRYLERLEIETRRMEEAGLRPEEPTWI